MLRGNLAPDTAIPKPGAFDKSLYPFEGRAKVFDSEDAANEAILNKKIVAGDVVVIRYEGPKGGPGMREMYRAMKYMHGQGLALETALVTDGRFRERIMDVLLDIFHRKQQKAGRLPLFRMEM